MSSARLPRASLPKAPGQPAIQLRGVENLEIGTSPSKAAMAKVSAHLLALHAEYQAYLQQTSRQGAATPAFKSTNTIAPVASGSVVIDTAASGDPQTLAADLRALGADKVTVFGRMVSARVPITAIPRLQDLSTLQFARPAYAAVHVGAVTSQGDAAMRADIGRTAFAVDGTGILIGTPIDDVIHGLGGNDIISGLGGNDVICGGPGRDRLFGNQGRDRLFGGAGRDVLRGGPGNDRLSGQSGNDAMNGQSGTDRCNGGSGRDTAASCDRTSNGRSPTIAPKRGREAGSGSRERDPAYFFAGALGEMTVGSVVDMSPGSGGGNVLIRLV